MSPAFSDTSQAHEVHQLGLSDVQIGAFWASLLLSWVTRSDAGRARPTVPVTLRGVQFGGRQTECGSERNRVRDPSTGARDSPIMLRIINGDRTRSAPQFYP